MVYLTEKNIKLIRAVLYLFRKDFALSAYKKRNLIRILNELLNENTLSRLPTMQKDKNKKIVRNYTISPSFNMTILKEQKEEEKLEGDEQGQNKIILYNKNGGLETEEYEIKENQINPGKCLVISRQPGTISHEVNEVKIIEKIEPKLPWKYSGKNDIILPSVKLFDWSNTFEERKRKYKTKKQLQKEKNKKKKEKKKKNKENRNQGLIRKNEELLDAIERSKLQKLDILQSIRAQNQEVGEKIRKKKEIIKKLDKKDRQIKWKENKMNKKQRKLNKRQDILNWAYKEIRENQLNNDQEEIHGRAGNTDNRTSHHVKGEKKRMYINGHLFE